MTKTDYSKLPPECDELCEWRRCLHRGENKGTFSPGRGYTAYYDQPEYVCLHRHLHGCPSGFSISREDGTRLSQRTLPDGTQLIEHFERMVREAKGTQKVKRQMAQMLRVIKYYIVYADSVQGENDLGNMRSV